MNWLAVFQNLKAVLLSVGTEHSLNYFFFAIFSVSLMARERRAAFIFTLFCEADDRTSIRCFLKTKKSRLYFISKISVYLNCLCSLHLTSFVVL